MHVNPMNPMHVYRDTQIHRQGQVEHPGLRLRSRVILNKLPNLSSVAGFPHLQQEKSAHTTVVRIK